MNATSVGNNNYPSDRRNQSNSSRSFVMMSGRAAQTERPKPDHAVSSAYNGRLTVDTTSRKRIVTMEFDVGDTVGKDKSAVSERSTYISRRNYDMRDTTTASGNVKSVSYEKIADKTTDRSSVTASRNHLGQVDSLTDGGNSSNARITNSTASNSVDKSSDSRVLRIDRNHRSVTSTSALGTVTATKTEVPLRIAALREEFTASRRVRAEQSSDDKVVSQRPENTAEANSARPGRRRRNRGGGVVVDHSENSTNQNSTARKPKSNTVTSTVTASSGLARRKFSPYPNYIQPVVDDSLGYRREVNRILSHDPRPSAYSNRNRKISTDMNRYESSSSSESEDDSSKVTVRPPVKMPNRLAVPGVIPETPDTSDCENPPTRRRRRQPRNRDPGENRSFRKARQSDWDEKYLSLPDNYKIPGGRFNAGSEVQSANRGTSFNSSSKTAPVVNRSDDTRIFDDSQRNLTTESRRVRNEPVNVSSQSKHNQLMIDRPNMSQSNEGLHRQYEPPEHTDISISTPNLVRVERQTNGSKIGNDSRKQKEDIGIEGRSAPMSNGQKNNNSSNFAGTEAVDSEVIPGPQRLHARKVGEDYWPRDEATERLLTQPPIKSGGVESPGANRSAASCAMQETIDQLKSFVNQADLHRPRQSTDRSKQLESGRDSPSHATTRRGSSNRNSSKSTSPHMSSTETLKEVGSAGEYIDKISRSPSFDSTTSNPELSNCGTPVRPTGLKGRATKFGDNSSSGKSYPNKDILQSGKSTIEKIQALTESVKTLSISQPASLQHVEPCAPVSPSSSLSGAQAKLETVSEDPEPQHPGFQRLPNKLPSFEIRSEDSLEIDEGVETDEDIKSSQKLDQIEENPTTFLDRQDYSLDKNAGNITTSESPRSLSDPSAERKRPQPSKNSNNVNLMPNLGKKQDMGSFKGSWSSSGQFSEQPSSIGDTCNEIVAEDQLDECKKNQIKDHSKKKSKSDPNPEGFTTIDSDISSKDTGYQGLLGSSNSEPNVLEQGDCLGDLSDFRQYQDTKPMLLILPDDDVPDMGHGISRSYKAGPKRPHGFSPTDHHDDQNRSFQNGPLSRESMQSPPKSKPIPVQKDSDEIREFEELYGRMSKPLCGDDMQQHPIHTRSVSEPVESMDLSSLRRSDGRATYGSTCNLPKSMELKAMENTQHKIHKGPLGPDKRLHVFKNLLDTEKSYVNSLRILFEDYMKPLKITANHSTCEPRLVDEMFYQIPELLTIHENFYESVQKCYDDWYNRDVMLGDLFLTSFNQDALLDTYTAYIKNYLNAREAVRIAKSKDAFRRFLEQCRSENKDKQGLADLMIKPVQRIPRYELLIKDMLKHTPSGHPDRDGLLTAQREIHKLADQMNKSEKEAEDAERQDRLLGDLELLIEGCVDLCVPKRRFLRQDIVTEIGQGSAKKDRSLWLFSDLIVCSTRKNRQSAPFRRGSVISLYFGHERTPSIEPGYKYKFLWKFPLEDVENLKTAAPGNVENVKIHMQSIQNDLEVLKKMQQYSVKIESPHSQLDDALRDLTSYLDKSLSEKQNNLLRSSPSGRVELGVNTGETMKHFNFEFEDKATFERLFESTKRSLNTFRSRWEPTFMKAIPIMRTRAGMQFSCAASNVDLSPDCKEVWVCNTDGFVGQVCVLALEPEPNQTQSMTVCNARICCIAPVPALERRFVPASEILNAVNDNHLSQKILPAAHTIISWDDDEDGDDSDEENTSPHSTLSNNSSIHSQSPYSNFNEEHPISIDVTRDGGMESAFRVGTDGTTLHGSLEELLQDGSDDLAGKDSMWLGTDDGKIHIFSAQSTRGNRQCIRKCLNAPVHGILHHDGQVFVALSNGELVVYSRDSQTQQWDFDNYRKTPEKSPRAITKMVVVGGDKLWCGCQNNIRIINMKDLTDIESFPTSNDPKRQVFCMVCCGFGVWVALDKRPHLRLYHTVSHDILTDIDVSNPVNKMLAGADAIIRQHKAACLRITALLVCNGLLWIGTSAGVVLTVTLPKIDAHSTSLAMPIIPQGLAYGHTGHVRFLASAEISDKDATSLSRGGSRRASTNRRRMSSSTAANQSKTVSVIISGGDGYEDFRMNSNSESAGRDDSTNHLLVWRA